MTRSLIFAGCCAVALTASPAVAWHEVGHMLTVLVAYRQLSPGDAPSATVQRLVAILKHHPRYYQDFARSMPKDLSADDEARWLLCRASVWPDQVRNDRKNKPSYPSRPAKQGSYHRGIWHYIDTPLAVVAEGTSANQIQALEARAGAAQDLATDLPKDEAAVKNALQAIAFNREKLAHGDPASQAVALCWLLHVMADIHQPLHAAAGFSTAALNPADHPHGDAGGNAIRLVGRQNLHALWDAAPDACPESTYDPAESFDQRYNRAYARALKQIGPLLSDRELNARGKQAAGQRDPQQWVRESYELAKTKVYMGEVRAAILAADRAGSGKERPEVVVEISDSYRAAAHEIGKLRVMQGGYRTAEFLSRQP